MPTNGLLTRASQMERLPPDVMSHCLAKLQAGRLRFMLPEYARVRLPTYETSITELRATRYWMPAENWCTRGILYHGLYCVKPCPTLVRAPSEEPKGCVIPLGNGLLSRFGIGV